MKSENIDLSAITLIGSMVRTNNKNEANPTKAKIGPLVRQYWQNQLSSQFQNRVAPGRTLAVYTEYDSDETGDYLYLIGEQVSCNQNQLGDEYHVITIPAGHYRKFTLGPGKIPEIVIAAWQEIWSLKELKSERQFSFDFEVYDHRAVDLNSGIVDLYISINK